MSTAICVEEVKDVVQSLVQMPALVAVKEGPQNRLKFGTVDDTVAVLVNCLETFSHCFNCSRSTSKSLRTSSTSKSLCTPASTAAL
eukprot:CAMPEP_0180511474 /NCGR_PEP_ID=MMETSP1036_2-20121128/51016_1 /TAXON_ID=632150 /ORGANISM="Azadinium spinosum, Strain 3D9" /LENGTH=85 /DNA_ID=CAMNT_0022522433 /DNA_START=115 /DNA_END=373 /DNA_ORIENTATION=-